MNIKQIKELIDLMNENDLTGIEIEQDGMKIKLAKKMQGITEQVITATAAKGESPSASQDASKDEKPRSNVKEVKAPMVGTFYRSASPDAQSYVEVGDIIQKGDVLCIVEAMKLMNEVKAEFGGRIVEINVNNAEAVEYGQIMFLVEPV
ncbi:MAG: acetyl-CoA carboxylase biotin carboxyl carrier protein [Candidatus Omnitrophota bacterium]